MFLAVVVFEDVLSMSDNVSKLCCGNCLKI